ncbi:hypothetical protein F4861DRAFT_28540 [Xylaria intraflava]|nr:hypothetical protein F4861DRAFT_28540 [Xylaria intraflava]
MPGRSGTTFLSFFLFYIQMPMLAASALVALIVLSKGDRHRRPVASGKLVRGCNLSRLAYRIQEPQAQRDLGKARDISHNVSSSSGY